jgi:hypothetical protein
MTESEPGVKIIYNFYMRLKQILFIEELFEKYNF